MYMYQVIFGNMNFFSKLFQLCASCIFLTGDKNLNKLVISQGCLKGIFERPKVLTPANKKREIHSVIIEAGESCFEQDRLYSEPNKDYCKVILKNST